MHSINATLDNFNELLAKPSRILADALQIILRAYMAWVFFPAGWLKLQDWDTTLFLFEEEYAVPLLSPELAAWLGTAGELIFPVLLVLGLATRLNAIGLFTVNLVAVISLADVPPAAMTQHLFWGLALAVLIVWGGGRITVDHLLNHLRRR